MDPEYENRILMMELKSLDTQRQKILREIKHNEEVMASLNDKQDELREK